MFRRLILPLIFGLAGVAILVALGVWQVQRLEWKQRILAEIESRIAAEPTAVPAAPDPEDDRFRPVAVSGRLEPELLRILTTVSGRGPGYRLISPLVTEDGRRLLVDRGFIPQGADLPAFTGPVEVEGNLHWPNEVDAFTPEPDVEAGLWYARDVPALAAALGTEPVLIVAREIDRDPAVPLPIDVSGIPNDHLEYAITWFTLAAIWAGMTGLLLWRIRHRPE